MSGLDIALIGLEEEHLEIIDNYFKSFSYYKKPYFEYTDPYSYYLNEKDTYLYVCGYAGEMGNIGYP
jgi:hypothetical protein